MNDKQWAERCMSLGSIPIDIKFNKETGKVYLECYKYKSAEFDTGLKEELIKFRKLIHGDAKNETT